MKSVTLCLAMLVFAAGAGAEDRLWYEQPASQTPWKQIHRNKDWRMRCLPIGNGQLGGMIFAHPHQERIQFNEDTLWVGDEQFVGNSLPFADLYVEQAHAKYTDYRRELDLACAVHTITYRSGGVNYKRQYFASNPDRVMVLHFTADRPGAHSGRVFLDDVYSDSQPQLAGNRIVLSGDDAGGSTLQGEARGGVTVEAQSLRLTKDKKRFNIRLARESQLRVLHKGGRIRIEDGHITFENVDELTLLLAAGTDFINQRSKGWRGEHPHQRLTADLDAASARPFDELLARHLADYRGLYDRFDIHLGDTDPKQTALPTDQRLAARVEGRADPELEALLYQYARYLMIASSRPGTMPAHLQGIWNRSVRPAWWGDYHTDVNIQMCYWFVDKANLSECYEPYVSWLNSIREVRRELTGAEFGVRGWTFGAMNGPFGGSAYYNVKGVAAWCAQNLYDHYRFTQDEQLLRERIYPILRELCWFWEDLLKERPDGTLVSPDGFSPEHGPKHVDGVSFDQQWIWDLFTSTIASRACEQAVSPPHGAGRHFLRPDDRLLTVAARRSSR
jgi:alpha-L-fucosidase 2